MRERECRQLTLPYYCAIFCSYVYFEVHKYLFVPIDLGKTVPFFACSLSTTLSLTCYITAFLTNITIPGALVSSFSPVILLS